MQKLTDKYFKMQTAKISSGSEDDWETITNDNRIYLALKEVARDQRYACAEAVRSTKTFYGLSELAGIVQNA